jgi:hypothetical protein
LNEIDLTIVPDEQVVEAKGGQIIEGKENEAADRHGVGDPPRPWRYVGAIGWVEQKEFPGSWIMIGRCAKLGNSGEDPWNDKSHQMDLA